MDKLPFRGSPILDSGGQESQSPGMPRKACPSPQRCPQEQLLLNLTSQPTPRGLTPPRCEASRTAINFLVWSSFFCIFGLDRSHLDPRVCATSTSNMTQVTRRAAHAHCPGHQAAHSLCSTRNVEGHSATSLPGTHSHPSPTHRGKSRWERLAGLIWGHRQP